MRINDLDSTSETIGAVLVAACDTFGCFTNVARWFLGNANIGIMIDGNLSVDAAGWYSTKAWLGVLRDVSQRMGGRMLFLIGMAIPQNFMLPSSASDIYTALAAIDQIYHRAHRQNGIVMFDEATQQPRAGIGSYSFAAQEGRNEIICTCTAPYPCAMNIGLLTGFARRFQPQALVKHDKDSGCQRQGGAECVYHISW